MAGRQEEGMGGLQGGADGRAQQLSTARSPRHAYSAANITAITNHSGGEGSLGKSEAGKRA